MTTTQTPIKATPENREILRQHAKEAMANYSNLMTWLILNKHGDLSIISEPQGQSIYAGSDVVLAATGGFYKAHGNGAATYYCTDAGEPLPYATQKHYLTDLLGQAEYKRIFTA
jgi:hypothetical protein